MKTTVISLPLGEMLPGGAVDRCTNLLSVSKEGKRALTVVPHPAAVAPHGYRPLACFHDTGVGEHMLLTRGDGTTDDPSWLSIMHNGSIDDVAQSEPPLTAIPRAGGFIVMTARGPVDLLRDAEDGSWSLSRRTPPDATYGISLSAVGCGTLSTATQALTVKDIDFSRDGTTVGASGRRAVGRELAAAYSRLAALAADGKVWMQPVLARYHLISSSGERVLSSEPVLVAPAAWQCVGAVSADCVKNGDALDIPVLHLHAQAFKIELNISDISASQLAVQGISAIEVCVTPQMHPLDESTAALEATPVRVQRASTTTPNITVALPGATDNFNSRNRRRADTLRALMARIDKAEQREHIAEQSFASAPTVIERQSPADLADESARISSVLSQSVTYNPADYSQTLLREISAPNSFTAAAATTSGDTVAWADITPLPAGASALTGIFAELTDGDFNGVLCASMRDGSVRRTAFTGTRRPTAWAPVVCYPDPQAVALEAFITEAATGLTLHGRITLSALADGSRAAAVASDLATTPFEKWSGTVPAADEEESAEERRPGAVVACRLAAPLTPVAAVECCHSPVMALLPAVRSQSWDFSRCHLYAFSAAAAYAVSINCGRSAIAASVIDPRGITAPDAVCRTPDAVMAVLSGRPTRVTASRTDAAGSLSGFSRAAWDPERQRLALLDGKGNLYLHDLTAGGLSLITAPVDFESMATVADTLWLCDSDTLMRFPQADQSDHGREIAWRSAVAMPPGCRAVALEVIMSASHFSGTIALTASASPAPAFSRERTLLSLRIDGAIHAPIVRRIIAPPRPLMHLALEGTASPDTVISRIAVRFTDSPVSQSIFMPYDKF